MSSLFSTPSYPSYQSPQYQAQTADMSTENAALFERIQRTRAYGVQQTRMVEPSAGTGRKTTLGG